MSAGTTTTTLRGLQPDTLYTVTLVPVYAAGDGKRMSENGKTSKFEPPQKHLWGYFLVSVQLQRIYDPVGTFLHRVHLH